MVLAPCVLLPVLLDPPPRALLRRRLVLLELVRARLRVKDSGLRGFGVKELGSGV